MSATWLSGVRNTADMGPLLAARGYCLFATRCMHASNLERLADTVEPSRVLRQDRGGVVRGVHGSYWDVYEVVDI